MSGQRWHVRGGGHEVELDPNLPYAIGWEWTVGSEGRERRVVVWVNRTASASELGDLAGNAVDAIATKGRRAVDRYLHWQEPPRRIQVTSEGLDPTGGSEE